MIDERIAARRREIRGERRQGRQRRTLTIVGLLLLAVAVVLIERSALVGLEEVEVTGTERLEPADVLAAADLALGTSTLRLRLGAVEDRVEALPLVRSASARRVDPLSVLIEVTERQPAVNARHRAGSVLVDRDGIVLAEGRIDGLPDIRLDSDPPEPGEDVSADPALANAHESWRSLSGPLRAEVVRYDAAGPDDLTLQLRSGIEVRFGRAERVEEKVRALGAVLEDLGDAEVAVIDVRAPTAPVVIGP